MEFFYGFVHAGQDPDSKFASSGVLPPNAPGILNTAFNVGFAGAPNSLAAFGRPPHTAYQFAVVSKPSPARRSTISM